MDVRRAAQLLRGAARCTLGQRSLGCSLPYCITIMPAHVEYSALRRAAASGEFPGKHSREPGAPRAAGL